MAAFRYFSDFNGETIAITDIHGLDNAKFAELFTGVNGKRSDSFQRFVGKDATGRLLPLTRSIERPGHSSNHKCDARCQNARGHKCECACGGHNHGKGA